MIFRRKKTSAVDRRLDELHREMAKVGAEIKTLARYQKTAGDGSALKTGKIRLAGSESGQAAERAAAAFSSAGGENRSPSPDDLPDGKQGNGETRSVFTADTDRGGGGGLPLFESRSPIATAGREKFANYFMAGHFHNLRPLRQEKRIIKNKAIIMIILVVLALIWLLFFLRG